MNSFNRVIVGAVLIVSAAVTCFAQAPAAAPATGPTSLPAESVLKPGDRIVFVGDSITGLGERNEGGFVRLMREALAKTHPEGKFELVTLGASGSTVGSWLNSEQRSGDPKEKEFFTDVPNNGVKANLNKHADVLIIMLGMNDVLQPQVLDEKESLDRWDASYLQLIQALRGRMHPRVVALGQCTMATEDPNSAMNIFIDKLNEHVAAVAQKAGCPLLKTDDEYKEMLRRGRPQAQTDVHVTYDYIHPNKAGQIAIATGMAGGLRDRELLTAIQDLLGTALGAPTTKQPEIAFEAGPLDSPGDFRIKYRWNNWRYEPPPRGQVVAPGGWSLKSAEIAYSGDLVVTADTFQVRNTLSFLESHHGVKPVIVIPPPWLLAGGIVHIWREHQLDEKAARTAIDDAIEQGKDFTKPIEMAMYSTSVAGYGVPKTVGALKWQRFFPSVDYTGGDAPGNADFQSIVYPHTFETGYGARWVYSDRDRPMRVEVSSAGFTRQTYVQVWLNGKKEYSGQVSDQPKMRTEVQTALKKGWNCLAFRCFHITYFFQCAVTLLPADKADTLDDLRYSTVFKDANSPAPAAK